MRFDRAEFEGQPAASACALCQKALEVSYFTLGAHAICTACRDAIVNGAAGTPVERMARAMTAGLAASFAGAVLYWGIAAATGYELGIIAIAVGLMVGAAVRWGAYRRGGWAYQALAMYLTYVSVGASYVALALGAGAFDGSNPVALAILVLVSIHTLPVIVGVKSILSIIIVGIGLYEAWKMNRSIVDHLAGPFPLVAAAPHG